MENDKLKEVLVEFQTQLNDLYKLQLDLNLSFNNQAKKLNDDFYKAHEEIYNKKSIKESKEMLETKKLVAEQFNKFTDERTENVIKMFDERFSYVHQNLEKIKEIF